MGSKPIFTSKLGGPTHFDLKMAGVDPISSSDALTHDHNFIFIIYNLFFYNFNKIINFTF
jgi:hypothetical protein